ncbi:MAG TPA: tetratricopeptide repeat protein, partial [Blastocatellia bacterium]|nr:tetratricopeptide repeat protein [Blastocatellia bacterium]
MIGLLLSIAVCLIEAVSVVAQDAPPASAPVRSHAERFATPEVRAERVESEATERLKSNPDDHVALNLRGLARMRLGRYAESFEDLRRATALKPDNAEYHANLGYVLWRLGRINEAVNAERTALKLDEKNFTARFQLGRFLLRLGGKDNLAEAVAHLRRAIELEPRNYDIRFELIEAFRALGDRAQASAQLEFLWDARPSDARVFYVSALLATDRDDLQAAIKDFKEAVRRDPSLHGAWQDLGLAYIKLKQWPEAIDAFAEMARRQPSSVDAAYLSALSLFNAGRAAEAESEVRRALRMNAGAAEAHTLLGVILASRGNANVEAMEVLSQAILLNPKSFDAHFYLGRILYTQKDYPGAVKELGAATAISPDHALARFFLGTALESAGESEAALAEYRQLVRIDPQSAYGQVGLGA